MLPEKTAKDIADKLRKSGFEPVLIGPLVFFLLFILFISYDMGAVGALFTALAALSPVWIPLFLLRYFWIMWMYYIRYLFWFAQDHILLEIVLPPEVEKSPLAMEVVLTALHNTGGEGTFIARIWKGNYRPVWSLEIASNQGRVSYYIHMRKGWRNPVEARIYGQFPEAKILLVEDYASKVPFNLEEYQLWGCEYSKASAGAVPIRTYYDYALDKDTDAPEKTVDPLSHVLELFSNIGKDEYMWLQFIVKARKKDEWYGFYKKEDVYKEGGKAEIKKVMDEAAKRVIPGETDKDKEARKQILSRGASILTQGERDKVESIEKATGKLVFEVGIRAVYLAKKQNYNGINVGAGLVPMFAPFASPGNNSINPTRGMTVFDYPWQDFHDIRKNRIKQQLFFHYRNRAYFYVPYDQTPMFLNTEELASLWHFPSSAVQPPGLERVAAKRAEAPAGLPTGL